MVDALCQEDIIESLLMLKSRSFLQSCLLSNLKFTLPYQANVKYILPLVSALLTICHIIMRTQGYLKQLTLYKVNFLKLHWWKMHSDLCSNRQLIVGLLHLTLVTTPASMYAS